jgi:hypothetical protein
MNEAQRLVRRLQAHASRRAVPTRGAFGLSPDPAVTIGITTIKIVTEEHVQAFAFGGFDEAPQVIGRIDPLGRDASDMEPFAAWLIEKFERARRLDQSPRVWLPHGQTLETLDVLGHRYERNPAASESLQRMGAICRIIAREHRYEGQQVVAIASSLLLDHVATGQSPAEDAHLGALLAWINPPSDGTTIELAARRAIEPAGGVLANHPARQDDDRIETLRHQWKRSVGARRAASEILIREILERAALDEWALLTEARAGFWRIGLSLGSLDACAAESKSRVLYALDRGGAIVPRNAIPRIREMTVLENSQELAQDAGLMADPVLRAIARRKGRVLSGRVVRVEQNVPGKNPCTLTVATAQRDLRFRRDDAIAAIGTAIVGKVLDVAYDEATGGSLARILVQKGVRNERAILVVGSELEWIHHNGFPLFMKQKAVNGLVTPWMLAEDGAAPPLPARPSLGPDLIAVAQRYLGGRT